VVGITATTLLINNAYRIASLIRKVFPNTKIVFGGHHPTALPEEVIKKEQVDAVVTGEGEGAVKELLEGKPLSEINGLVYKDRNGKVFLTRREN